MEIISKQQKNMFCLFMWNKTYRFIPVVDLVYASLVDAPVPAVLDGSPNSEAKTSSSDAELNERSGANVTQFIDSFCFVLFRFFVAVFAIYAKSF